MRFARFAAALLVGLIGGVLYAATPLVSWGGFLLCWIAILPWALLYGRPGSRASILAVLPGIALFMNIGYWNLQKYGLMFSAILSVESIFVFGAALLLLRSTGRWMPAVPIAVRLPVLWTAADYLWSRLEVFRAYGFYLANPLSDWPVMVQAADIVGGVGLTFAVAMVNGLIADLLLLAWRRRRTSEPGPAPSARAIAAAGMAACALVAFVVFYGLARIDRSEPSEGPRLALIQPNLPHIIGWPLGVHLEEMYQTVRDVPPGRVDIVMWPENSVLDFYDLPDRYLDDLRWLTRSLRCNLLFGAMGRSKDDPFRTTNTAVLLSQEGRIEGSYEKIDVIPWAEYFPFERFLSRFSPSLNLVHVKLATNTLSYFPSGTPGEKMTSFPFTWQGRPLPFSVVLCSEGTLPIRSRQGAALGSRFIVNLISEGELGPRLQRCLLRQCRMRAIENRIPFIRVGNTGISCTLDESGRIRDVLRGAATGSPINEAGTLLTQVPLPARHRRALYTSIGDLIPIACLGLMMASAVISLAAWRRRRGRRALPAAALALLLAAAIAATGCRARPARGPADFDSALQRGLAAFKEGRDHTGLRLLQRAAEIAPERPDPYPYIAQIFKRRGRVYAGYRFFQARSALAAGNPEIGSCLGFFQREVHRKSDAVRTFKASLQAKPDQEAPLLWLTALLEEANRQEEALPFLRRYLAVHPDDAAASRWLAEALVHSGHHEEAAPLLARLLTLSPERAGTLLRLAGIVELSAGRLDEAQQLMEKSASADPKSMDAQYYLARIAMVRGRPAEARRAIDAIHELEKGDSHR